MQLEEKQLNVLVLPVINKLLPEGVRLQHITLKENAMEWDIVGPGLEDTVGRRYWVQMKDFSFQSPDPFIRFSYQKVELPYGLEDVPGPGLYEWLNNHDRIHVTENEIKYQFNDQMEEFPLLQKLDIQQLVFHEGSLQVIFETKNNELIPMQMSGEQRRFYDDLRKKIEDFMREKMGDQQAEKVIPYLLLAPDLFVLLVRLIKDQRVEVQAKAVLVATVLYFMTPLDFIPEALIGPMGFLDDVVLAVFALKKIIGDVDESILREHWNGKENILHVIQDVIEKADDLVGTKRLNKITDYLKKKAR